MSDRDAQRASSRPRTEGVGGLGGTVSGGPGPKGIGTGVPTRPGGVLATGPRDSGESVCALGWEGAGGVTHSGSTHPCAGPPAGAKVPAAGAVPGPRLGLWGRRLRSGPEWRRAVPGRSQARGGAAEAEEE